MIYDWCYQMKERWTYDRIRRKLQKLPCMAHTPWAIAGIQDHAFPVALSGTKMDQRRDRKKVRVLMLDEILWFGFGAILIFPYGVWCGAKWSGGYKKWKIIVIYVLHVMIQNFVSHVASPRSVPNLKSVLNISHI